MSLLVLFYFFILLTLSLTKDNPNCALFDTCGACIHELGCAWCISSMQLSGFRPCFHESQINEFTNSCLKIINPQTEAQILVNEKLSTGKDAIQLSPQKVRIKLRRGQEYKLDFRYAQAADYPVDLYYVMDLSGSMEQYRNQLSILGYELAETMRNLTRNFRIGFGSFVDKPILPFNRYTLSDPCVGPYCDYVFQNHLSLTDREDIFSKEVMKAPLYDGGDSAEDGLDAILQAIVCQTEIGWRKKARRLLVFTTDASFHLAGDGRTAGIVVPHDDFPTIGLINYKALEYGINIIFAVTKDKDKDYIILQKRIKNSFIKILNEDSSNVIDLIKEFYGKIVDSVRISHNPDKNIEVKYFSTCTDNTFIERNHCDDIHTGVQVNFTAVLKLIECPKDGQKSKTILIKPSGLTEALQVEIEISCECDCDKPGDPYYKANATECSNNGHLKCGVCECGPNKLGSTCECDRNTLNSVDNSNCRPDNVTEFCSGVGTCRCNKCICQKRNSPRESIYGKYCQCDNYSCKRHNGKLCSGETRGTCDCGECRCLAGFTGEACECPLTNWKCIPQGNDQICSGNGECRCGKCNCKKGYSGKFCEECDSCKGSRCMELQHCVALRSENCSKYEIEVIERIDENNLSSQEKLCVFIDEAECYIKFKYWYSSDQSIKIDVQKERICSETDVLAIIFIIIGSILLGGLVMLAVWKILTDIHDRKEYAKFEAERREAGWYCNDNPLFKNATTSFINPTFSENLD